MKYTYDADADAVFLYLVDHIGRGEAVRSALVDLYVDSGAVNVELDGDGHALGVEFLGASKLFTEEAIAGFRAGRSPSPRA